MWTLLCTSGCKLEVEDLALPVTRRGIGIDIAIIDGQPAPLRLRGGSHRFFVDKLTIRVQELGFPAPEVLQRLQTDSDFASLDWTDLTRVMTTWEAQRDGSFREVRGYLEAVWMNQSHLFRLEFLDADDEVLEGPIELSSEEFLIPRRTAMVWIDGQPQKGDLGENQGNYDQLILTSRGGCDPGAVLYRLEVVQRGDLQGEAEIVVSAADGEGGNPIAVHGRQPIPLGSAGGTVTFVERQAGTVLELGDSWLARCDADDQLQPPEPGQRATFSAMAEVRLATPSGGSPDFAVPAATTQLRVRWSAKPGAPYVVPVELDSEPGFAQGLEVAVSVSAPKDRSYFRGGESVEVTIDLLDESGTRLHPKDSLPTYGEFMRGAANGIQYFRSSEIPSAAGFFAEGQVNFMMASVFGPRHRIRTHYGEEEPSDWFVTQQPFPETRVIFGGFQDPTVWDTPLPNHFTVELPETLEQGTYVVAVKAHRSYLGESVQRLETVEFQVGGSERTEYVEAVGNCGVCHVNDSGLERMRHGTDDYRFCAACHRRPNQKLSVDLTHRIHFFSPVSPIPKSDCSLCHLASGSNTRASEVACVTCHQSIHPVEPIGPEIPDPYQACARTCHGSESVGHVPLPPQ